MGHGEDKDEKLDKAALFTLPGTVFKMGRGIQLLSSINVMFSFSFMFWGGKSLFTSIVYIG